MYDCNYNDIYYSNYKSNCNNLNITTLLNYKKLNYKKLIKKYNNKYYFYNQYLVQTYNNYFITKKISTNKVKYFYNQNSVNNIINQNLFKIYYGYLIHNSAKLFKTLTEGNILVKLTNISFTPNKTTGRMIYDFSATATEIAETTIENYDKVLTKFPCDLIKSPRKIQTKTPYFIKFFISDSSYFTCKISFKTKKLQL